MRITMIQNVQISELAMPLPLKIYQIFRDINLKPKQIFIPWMHRLFQWMTSAGNHLL